MRTTRLVLISLLLTLASGAWLSCTADIRPEALRAAIPETAQQRGRQLLQRAAELHGISAWPAGRVARVEIHDRWPDNMMTKIVGPFAARELRYALEFTTGTDNSRLRFLDGPQQGQVWGIQQWATYRVQDGQVVFKEDSDLKFWLPTLQYFVELPYRITQATAAAYAGQQSVGGVTYDLVLASWNTLAPQSGVDQYLLYINAQSGLLEFAQFTVRDIAPFAVGIMHYSSIPASGDIRLARDLQSLDSFDNLDVGLHHMTIDSISFPGDLQPADLLPDPAQSGTK